MGVQVNRLRISMHKLVRLCEFNLSFMEPL